MIPPVWIEIEEALVIHSLLLAEHGGAVGVQDRALLESALARPKQCFSYESSNDIIQMAALYTTGIVKNHPFVDGNKRTGFVIGILFLDLNGYAFNASEEDAACAVLGLASGTLDEQAYAMFLKESCTIIGSN